VTLALLIKQTSQRQLAHLFALQPKRTVSLIWCGYGNKKIALLLGVGWAPVSDEITVERLERALALCAYLVVLHGPEVAPLFEKLERELEALRAKQNTVERAKKLLESYKSHRPPLLEAPR
jgi:hypothetical protein